VAIHLEKIMGKARDLPFGGDYFGTAQRELPQASGMLYLSKDRLNYGLSPPVSGTASFGLPDFG
jgi:hypothetical protein